MQPVRYHVLHETRYDYGSPVSLSQQQLHLSPRVLPWQLVEEQRIDIVPAPTWRRDGADASATRSAGSPSTRRTRRCASVRC
jgi:transglutaminase-like putative cysteine protease